MKTSTTQCSWLVQEVANHFLRSGSKPIITLLDCSKAFDTCQFSTLFTRLIDRGMPAIVVRVIIFVYEEQYAWVMWGGSRSSLFPMVNGTRLIESVTTQYENPRRLYSLLDISVKNVNLKIKETMSHNNTNN